MTTFATSYDNFDNPWHYLQLEEEPNALRLDLENSVQKVVLGMSFSRTTSLHSKYLVFFICTFLDTR